MLHHKIVLSSEDLSGSQKLYQLLSDILLQKKVGNIHVEQLSGAMTNFVYKVLLTGSVESHTFLVRIYGHGSEQFFDRAKELSWLGTLSRLGNAPRVLAFFENGRVEEYLDAETLTHTLIRMPEISAKIGIALARLHKISIHSDLDNIKNKQIPESEMWAKLYDWHTKAVLLMNSMDNESQSRIGNIIDVESLRHHILRLEKMSIEINSPVVYSHNDIQYGNIMLLHSSDTVMLIDYEYSGLNHRGFDIANHFCEWMANYHTDTPHFLDISKYPTANEQLLFIKSYVDHAYSTQPSTERKLLVEQIKSEVRFFNGVSHLLWGLWGIIQSKQSAIHFDFLEYGLLRLQFYKDSIQSISTLYPSFL